MTVIKILSINNNENILSKQIQQIKQNSQENEYIIKGKLAEKESEIQIMKQQIAMLTESYKEIRECLKYPQRLTQILNEK